MAVPSITAICEIGEASTFGLALMPTSTTDCGGIAIVMSVNLVSYSFQNIMTE
jgi:hypothetical protein